ncbi:hypothetical protein GDI2277 [Gluconacetobacter diazotrophicus PA1 5]|uniref:Uncharacterized protein n=1 Tax=Gluconacetobacter diazotrophicus (strain ATCC 49037 / DSM 5601 / CCUG 37298 / CIP 103539 / LMG 7603 / PAl5) TaxID=272568 RepID=A9HLW3_GLUDA|nr:hypothetical protein GDI2277 [Gluconacetobacter diazotrophicus PA1 5]
MPGFFLRVRLAAGYQHGFFHVDHPRLGLDLGFVSGGAEIFHRGEPRIMLQQDFGDDIGGDGEFGYQFVNDDLDDNRVACLDFRQHPGTIPAREDRIENSMHTYLQLSVRG